MAGPDPAHYFARAYESCKTLKSASHFYLSNTPSNIYFSFLVDAARAEDAKDVVRTHRLKYTVEPISGGREKKISVRPTFADPRRVHHQARQTRWSGASARPTHHSFHMNAFDHDTFVIACS